METRRKLQLCVAANGALTALWVAAICTFGDGSHREPYSMANWFRFGPNPSLNVMGVAIGSWPAYAVLVLGIVVFEVVKTCVHEIAHPIIGFRIYNPDHLVIEEFSRCELQVYGNLMYLFDNVRNVFLTMLAISQVDIALWGTLAAEITSIFTIRNLLKKKKFVIDDDDGDDAPLYDV
tara:strand:+ start:1374 stop:1907 length:534 start_codon:yes stop_codon:yes gene_type:complete